MTAARVVGRGEVPQSAPAEDALLCALLLPGGPLEALELLRAEHFDTVGNQTLYAAMQQLRARDIEIDAVTVGHHLELEGLLDLVGGRPRLNALMDATLSRSNWRQHVAIIKETWTRRRTIHLAAELAEAARGTGDTTALAARTTEIWSRLTALHESADDVRTPFADIGAILDGKARLATPTLMPRRDGESLLYLGKLNAFNGEPTAGKSLLALGAANSVLAMGGDVVMIDFEDTAETAVARLLTLGANPVDVRNCFHHVTPDGETMQQTAQLVIAKNPDIVIVDSVHAGMSAFGLDEDLAGDVETFVRELIRPITRNRSAVLWIDHVAKSKESRGEWVRGSGHKRAVIDGAAYTVTSTGFNRTTPGHIHLRVTKDRNAGLIAKRGELIASVWIRPSPHHDGTLLTVEPPLPEARPADSEQTTDRLRTEQETAIADRILTVLDTQNEAISRRSLATRLRAKTADGAPGLKYSDKVLDVVLVELVDAHKITRSLGRNDSHQYALPPRQQALDIPQETHQ